MSENRSEIPLSEIEEAQKGLRQSIELSRKLVARSDQLIGYARGKVEVRIDMDPKPEEPDPGT